jgi:DNA-binding response OmpR family regulator
MRAAYSGVFSLYKSEALVAWALLIQYRMKKILLFDGSLSARGDLPKRLTELGFEVIRNSRGKTIAERDQHADIDLVLVTGGPKDLNGSAAVSSSFSCPIVFLSTEAAVESALAALADFAALKKENDELKKTLEARKMIERAKGLLMKNRSLSEAEAFSLLQKKSMDLRRPMVDIAEAIILSEEIAKEKAG